MKINMIGRITQCVLLAYRTPADSVAAMLPPPLKLLRRGDWAFWNVVACRVQKMRPAGFPSATGVSYHHIAYRLYCTAGNFQGLYFLRSDVDNRFMSMTGNWMTNFRFHPARISLERTSGQIDLRVSNSYSAIGDATLRLTLNPPPADHSPCFTSAAEAAEFLKYRPLGISANRAGNGIKLAEVFRDESQWIERPATVLQATWNFFPSLKQNDIHLEMATVVEPIDYRWQLGRTAAID